MCMAILSMCMYMYHRHAWCPWRNLGLELRRVRATVLPTYSGNFPKSKHFTQLLISSLLMCCRGRCSGILLHLTALGLRCSFCGPATLALDYKSHNAF